MLIKEVISCAAELLQLSLSAEDLQRETPEGEAEALLKCYQLVENEVALDFFPLKRTDVFAVKEGKAEYSAFPESLVDICSVRDTRSGRSLRFEIYPEYALIAGGAAEVEITYTFSPKKGEWGGETAFGDKISERLLAFGVASEYCLRTHRVEEARTWGERYRDALRAAGILRRTLSVRSRRWV